jgi:hypothetical protein
MKKIGTVLLTLFLLVVLVIVVGLGFLGYIPGLSKLLGADKPRDLGITYTDQDFAAARAKSGVVYEALPADTPAELSLVRSGSKLVTASWTSAEMTSLMNNRPWKYWPIKDVQLRMNEDGTAELSGVLMKDKLSGYAAGIGAPAEVADMIAKFLPSEPTFYVKAKASLTDNKVSEFDVQSVNLGKMPLPVNTLLAGLNVNPVKPAYAADLLSELSKYQNKRQMVIDFINERLGKITGFYAKSANFEGGKLNFDGSLSEKESTVR